MSTCHWHLRFCNARSDSVMKPTAETIKQARKAAGLTQTTAAALIHSTLRTWQDWEADKADMHAGLWELFKIKTTNKKLVDSAQSCARE